MMTRVRKVGALDVCIESMRGVEMRASVTA